MYCWCEVEFAARGRIAVGRHTSIQDFSVLHGDIAIGAYCVLAARLSALSTIHRFRDVPYWNIRDQDALVSRDPARLTSPSANRLRSATTAGSAATSPLFLVVCIGRGAIIGANCVVVKDVPPYEIHGGVPNRRLGARLDFTPPKQLDALIDAHLPYFYAGFKTGQDELAESRSKGAIALSGRSARLVLPGGDWRELKLSAVGPSRGRPSSWLFRRIRNQWGSRSWFRTARQCFVLPPARAAQRHPFAEGFALRGSHGGK